MSTTQSIADIRRLSPEELKREKKAKSLEYARLKLAVAMQSEKNHGRLRHLRRDLARMTMVLREPAHEKKTSQNASQTTKKSVQRPRSKSSAK